MSRRLTPRGQERRDQILRYSTERFAKNGYHTTSVSDIVEGLGVGKGVFYWYFESKEELFLEILRTGQRDLRRAQRRAIAAADNPLDAIEIGLRAALEWAADNSELFTLFEVAESEADFADAVREGRRILAGDVRPHIVDAIEQGLLPPAEPELAAYAVLAVTSSLTIEFIHRRDVDPATVAAETIRFCLGGLGAPI